MLLKITCLEQSSMTYYKTCHISPLAYKSTSENVIGMVYEINLLSDSSITFLTYLLRILAPKQK